DRLDVVAIEDAIRKAFESRAARVPEEYSVCKRVLAHALNGRSKLIAKLGAEPHLLLLVPPICFQGVGARLAPKDHLLHFVLPPMSASTCSQGTPTGPS